MNAGEKVAETVARHLDFDLKIVEFKPKNLMEEAEKILKISDFQLLRFSNIFIKLFIFYCQKASSLDWL